MTPIEAEKIINDYWKSIKDIGEFIKQPISDLPCSPGKIRYAHFIYGEELVKRDLLTWEIADKLAMSYSDIHDRFVEDPTPMNKKHKKYIEKLKEGVKDKNYHEIFCAEIERKIELVYRVS